MLTLTIGSFALAINHLLLILALALATLVGWRVAKRGGENPESVLFSLFLLGLLSARVGFVLSYWRYFKDDPLQILDLRDGGFLLWPGLLAVLVGALIWGWPYTGGTGGAGHRRNSLPKRRHGRGRRKRAGAGRRRCYRCCRRYGCRRRRGQF